MEEVLERIRAERAVQRERFPDDRYFEAEQWLPILIEEVGEVGRAILEVSNLEEELVQVAAVAVAWLEDIKLVRQHTEEKARLWETRNK